MRTPKCSRRDEGPAGAGPSSIHRASVVLGRDVLDDDLPSAHEEVRVRPNLDRPGEDATRSGCLGRRDRPGTVQDEPAGRSAFASVMAIVPKDGAFVKTSM